MRSVGEYRGHRIVTDGRRFGVEWPDRTELRYETTKDARTEIDSELASSEYRRWREKDLYLFVPDDSPFVCSCCGGRGERSETRRHRRRDEPVCESEPDAVIVFRRGASGPVRVGAIRSIAARAFEMFEEPAGNSDHRRMLEGVAESLRQRLESPSV